MVHNHPKNRQTQEHCVLVMGVLEVEVEMAEQVGPEALEELDLVAMAP